MTVDIARANGNAMAALDSSNDALMRLGQWVAAARDAHSLVSPLVDTAFVPDAYKPKVDPRATPEQKAEARAVAVANATAAVLQGISLGIDPLMALQQIYIVHGRPGMYAKMMVALVQAHGHEVWDEDLSDSRAVVCGRRKGSEHVVRVVISMDQARKAGWTSNQAYTKTPQDMLWSRAAARVCDRIASDVLKGIASVEQIRDEIRVEAEVGEGTRTVTPRRRAAPPPAAIEASTEDPPLDDEAGPDPAPAVQAELQVAYVEDDGVEVVVEEAPKAPVAGGITPAQSRMLHALLRDTGRTDRDVALVYISGVLGREVESTKELTKADAGRVIDALNTNVEPLLDEEA